jgi:hypothetical protein
VRTPLVVAALSALSAIVSSATAALAEPEAPQPPRDDSPFRMATGVDYRRIHDFGVLAGDIEASLRRGHGPGALYVGAELLLGDTEYQLAFVEPRLSLGVEWVRRRFRFGLGGGTGVISIARATQSTPATAFFVGIHGYVSCDLTSQTPDRGTPFVLARLSVDDVIGAYPWPLPWGPSLRVGYRF